MREVIETTNFVAEATEWIAARIIAGQKVNANADGLFRLSLCGGSTPKSIYAALAIRGDIDWSRVLITFGDERCVPPDHADSNYRMARETMLEPAGIPEENVIRMEGELPPAEAASRSENRLRQFAAESGEPIFRHDLVLLGMGGDGHTASLFPGSSALEESERWVVENHVEKFNSWRITITYPLIRTAACAAFLVNGPGKRPIVEEVLSGKSDYPAGRVEADRVVWLLG